MGGCASKQGISETTKKGGKPIPKSNFTSAESLDDFSKFFPGKVDSALSRNLTKEIWEEYKDESDEKGVSFKTCIFSGIANLDSGIGVYAGCH